MAAFKVGQRVRVIVAYFHPENMGREGVIAGGLGLHAYSPFTEKGRPTYLVDLLGYPHPIHGTWTALPEQLAPLTDPAADAFLETVKSWKPEPVAPPLPVKERA